MSHSFYLAWRYLQFHKGQTAVLVAVLTLITYLPLAMQMLVRGSVAHLLERARSTPLVIGPQGSALDLVMHALYFVAAPSTTTSMAEVERVDDSGLAYAIPIYQRFSARGYPIVGTTLDYLAYRHLEIARGRSLAVLGECLLGATVGVELGLGPGDTLVSTPEQLFDLAGTYPLKMRVIGVLQATHTPDDRSIFVDIKTAWIIAGLGHGHEDVARVTDPQVRLEQRNNHVVASAKLEQYIEITPANIDTFHFHGDITRLPLTAILAGPADHKSGVLLRGRYVEVASPTQIVIPTEVIETLMRHIFKIKRIFAAIFVVVSVVTLLAVVLVMALSWRLRQEEMRTMFKLGCSRRKIAELVAAELSLILGISLSLTAGLTVGTVYWQADMLQRLLI
jgi:putative ABC transport system permease protein